MLIPSLKEEKKLWKKGFRRLAGVDEVGRGALAGPVVAAAVSSTKQAAARFQKKLRKLKFKLRDSKRLLPHQREEVARLLLAAPGFEIKIAYVQPKTIDRINIRQATLRALSSTVQKLNPVPHALLIDGTETFPYRSSIHRSVNRSTPRTVTLEQFSYIKGDTKIFLIALASIAAKVARDKTMTRLAKAYPNYGFEMHKGYGTKMHKRRIRKFGSSPIHRVTFCKK